MLTRRNVVIAFGAFLLGLAAAVLYLREPTEPLTTEALARARTNWQAAQIRSYRISYNMFGSLYEVTVADGLVTELLLNGKIPAVSQPGAYSVPGLFETLEAELENIHDPSRPLGEGVVARVRFQSELGYPLRYIRAGTGVSRGATIETVSFEPR